MGKTKKHRKYLKKQKIQHRHNKRLKFIPMSVATRYDLADIKGPRWRTRRRVREYERWRAFRSILRHYADKCVADDLPTLDYHYQYCVPSRTDYICNHTYSDGKTAIIFNEDDNAYQCSLCGKKFFDEVFINKLKDTVKNAFKFSCTVKEYHGLITLHKKDDLLSLATLENANKNYDSKTEVKEARVIPEFGTTKLLSERNSNEQEE